MVSSLLPVTDAAGTRFAPPEESAPTLLVVDDQDAIRNLILLMLHFGGYEAHTASGGNEARALLAHGAPDLLITDLNMPSGDGGELIAFCRTHYPDLPILIVSGVPRGSHPEIERCTDGYLTKPFSHGELLATVARLLPGAVTPARVRGRDPNRTRSLDESGHDGHAQPPRHRRAPRAG